MARPYAKLRGIMHEHDDTQETLGRALMLSTVAISARFNNRADWKLSEIYTILDRYGIPHSRMHLIFPEKGRNEIYRQ